MIKLDHLYNADRFAEIARLHTNAFNWRPQNRIPLGIHVVNPEHARGLDYADWLKPESFFPCQAKTLVDTLTVGSDLLPTVAINHLGDALLTSMFGAEQFMPESVGATLQDVGPTPLPVFPSADHLADLRKPSLREGIIPEIEDIQRRRGVVRYIGDEALRELADVENAAFREWVRDALRHYWGGPKLAESPLLGLSIVERAASESGVPGVQGLRSVLRQAIEALRPGGERQMTTPEWVLYNILELKFLQGRRVREVARRLAMSEADLYRKQRVAIEAVAELVAEMEREALKHRRSDPDSVDTDTAAAYNRPVDSFPGAMDRARTR